MGEVGPNLRLQGYAGHEHRLGVCNQQNIKMCTIFMVRGIFMNEYDQMELDEELAVEEVRPKLEEPPLYKVMLLNDEFTPMDFVVGVITEFFRLDETRAQHIMWEVHTKGCGVCGVFMKDVAETKVAQVNSYSRSHGYPLLCTMEAA